MKTLELKHVKGYLDAKLKVIYKLEILNQDVIKELTIDNYEELIVKNKAKLILRPISDLTEEKWESIFVNPDIDNILSVYQSDKNLNCVEYYLVRKLQTEYHFDIFNLIEKGLAVDINTLKQ